MRCKQSTIYSFAILLFERLSIFNDSISKLGNSDIRLFDKFNTFNCGSFELYKFLIESILLFYNWNSIRQGIRTKGKSQEIRLLLISRNSRLFNSHSEIADILISWLLFSFNVFKDNNLIYDSYSIKLSDRSKKWRDLKTYEMNKRLQ
jgi:hypothetical protein